MKKASIGILDLGECFPGQTPAEACHDTIKLAIEADRLGFARYWLAEHQTRGCAWGSPELLVATIAALTSRIRVGPGGLLLRIHNPLRIAADFSLLEHLYPDRIDLGLARGCPVLNGPALLDGRVPECYGQEQAIAMGHQKDSENRKLSEDLYTRKVNDLLLYLTRGLPEGHPYFGSRPVPLPPPFPPQVWVHGGERSMKIAAQFGLGYGYPVFHPTTTDIGVLTRYQEEFQYNTGPQHVVLAVAGYCGESELEVSTVIKSYRSFFKPTFFGTPSQCQEQFEELSEQTNVSSLVFLDISRSFEQRRRCYRLLSEAFRLTDTVST